MRPKIKRAEEEDSFLKMIIKKLKGRREIIRRGGWRIVRGTIK